MLQVRSNGGTCQTGVGGSPEEEPEIRNVRVVPCCLKS